MIALLLSFLLAAQDAKKYIWEKLEASPPGAEAEPFRQELASQVRLLIQAGPPSSALFVVGIGGAHQCFANSAETAFALAEALPFLPEDLKPPVKEYLKRIVAEHPFWTPACFVGPTPWRMYAPAPPALPEAVRRTDVPLANAYFAWKYAEATGDWASIEKGYEALKVQVGRIPEVPLDYPQTIGAIGWARLARHFGKDADVAWAEARAQKGLDAGRDYEKTFDANLPRHLKTHDWAYPPFTERRSDKIILTAFAPEICRMLRETSQDQVRRHAEAVMDAWARTWFLTRPNLPTFYGPNYFKPGVEGAPRFMKRAWTGEQQDFGQENATWTPDVACTLFLLRAYVFGEPAAGLARYLDVPWTRSGDVYHLLKLVAILRSSGTPRWSP